MIPFDNIINDDEEEVDVTVSDAFKSFGSKNKPVENRLVKNLNGGQKRRISFAELLILDE